MINLDFSLAIGLYLLLTLLVVALWWIIFENQVKKKGVLRLLPKRNVWHCSICAHIYIDKEGELSVCPRCKSYNIREERRERGEEE
ncbi:MAG: hypothetical protein NC920_05090 [Candidatus Omnitrophica bacterium]|nr:hypothetical protein [Candidatus Omnitrophota bacterium]MCM8797912.1 hypothetical protein [Candidatus Omnitrophota bacterium]